MDHGSKGAETFEQMVPQEIVLVEQMVPEEKDEMVLVPKRTLTNLIYLHGVLGDMMAHVMTIKMCERNLHLEMMEDCVNAATELANHLKGSGMNMTPDARAWRKRAAPFSRSSSS